MHISLDTLKLKLAISQNQYELFATNDLTSMAWEFVSNNRIDTSYVPRGERHWAT